MRRIGLSKRHAAPVPAASSQSSKLSLDDESQQPPIAATSSAPAPSSSQPPAALNIVHELEQQFPPRSAPSSLLSSPPPTSSRSDALPIPASSELTEAESDDSIKWETNVTINVGHMPGLPQIAEEPVLNSNNDPSLSPSSFLVSQSPQYANDALAEANDSTEVSEGHDEPEEPDDISTPSSSHPDNTASAPHPASPTQNQTLRPLSNRTIPILPPSSSPHRHLISPSRHATNISPPAKRVVGSPSKRAVPASPSKRASAFRTSSSSGKVPSSATHQEPKRSKSPDESSDFARGMSPVLRPFDYLNSMTGNGMGLHRAGASKPRTGLLSSSQPAPGLEPTLLNKPQASRRSAPPVSSSPAEAVQTSQTLLNTDPAGSQGAEVGVAPGADGSQTQLNSVELNAPEGSQTQLNSDPVGHGSVRRFASLVSSRPRSSSPDHLFSESLDDIGAPERPNLQESFIATQVKALPTSPPAPGELEPTYVDSPGHSADQAGEDAERTPVQPPRNIFPSSLEPQPAPRAPLFTAASSEPPIPTDPAQRSVSASPSQPSPSQPSPSQPSPSQPSPSQPSPSPNPSPTSPSKPPSQESLFRPPPPRFSPNKYGKRRGNVRIPSSRAAMPPEDRRLSTETRSGQTPQGEATPLGGSDKEGGGDGDGAEGDGAEGDGAEGDGAEGDGAEGDGAEDVQMEDSSSSSAPDDPNDETFHDTPQGDSVKPPPPARASPNPPPPPAQVAPKKTTRSPKKAKSTHPVARPSRGKRKAMSPAPSFSDSSSSAPEDNEDFSYKPTKVGRAKAQATARASRKAAREASRQMTTDSEEQPRAPTTEPPRKRPRTAGPSKSSSKPSSKVSSRASTRVPSTSDVGPDPNVPLRVLALWSTTNEYYAGTIAGRNKQGFRVKFDDGYHRTLSVDRLRRLELRPGDPVLNGTKSAEVLHVAEQYDGGAVVAVVNARGKASTIPLARLVVLPNDIAARFDDRMVASDVVERRFAPSSAPVPRPFEGKVFIVSGKDAGMSPETLRRRIEMHGGTLLDDWTALFKISDDTYALSTPAAPFVLQAGDRCVLTPKIMSALAAGVPVLAARYVEDASAAPVDWRAYLISPGLSAVLGQPASQVVDPRWGEADWRASDARATRQPLQGAQVLYVEPSGRFKRRAEMRVIVPFCLLALGARVTRAPSLPADTARFDLVMVEDRDPGLPLSDAAKASGQLVNVAWLKACLVAGAKLPPTIDL